MCKKTRSWTNSLFDLAKVALTSMEELIQKDIAIKSRVKVLQLIWSVQDHSLFQPSFFLFFMFKTALQPMLPQFTSFLEQTDSMGLDLQISIYYIRATTTSPEKIYTYLPPAIGRPLTNNILDSPVDRTCNKASNPA
jgi:hypothetical protein